MTISRPSPLGMALQGLAAPLSLAKSGHWAGFGAVAVGDCIALALGLNGNILMGLGLFVALRALTLFAAYGGLLTPRAVPLSLRTLAGAIWLAALGVILLTHSGTGIGATLESFPSSRDLFQISSRAIDQSIRSLTLGLGPVFDQIRNGLFTLIVAIESLLGLLPWPVYFLFLGFLAWSRGGYGTLALVWGCLGYLGIFGYWEKALVTSSLVLASLSVCMVIGIPLGIAMAKNRRLALIMGPVLDFMQTLPSFVYLLPAVAFFSIGKPPALMATVIFAMPPLIRLTALGITQVPGYVREALYAHGATPLQCLIKAEIPLALPSIRTGLNQCIMMSLAMVVIAALIGGGGLGYDVLFALQNVQHGQGLLAGIGIVACAMLFDRIVGRARNSDDN